MLVCKRNPEYYQLGEQTMELKVGVLGAEAEIQLSALSNSQGSAAERTDDERY